jgi:hypothetical protein
MDKGLASAMEAAKKRWPQSVHVKRSDAWKTLTEGDEEGEGGEKTGELHVEGVEIEVTRE